MNTREEFEKWCKENTDLQNYYIDPSGQYANDHVLYAYEAWQEQQKKIDELQLKLDIKDDAMSGYRLVIKHLQENIK